MPSLFSGLFGPIFIAALLVAALLKILKVTEDMSGEFGAMASEYAGKALGVAVAAPTAGGIIAGGALKGVGALASYGGKKLGGRIGGGLDTFGKGAQFAGKGVGVAGNVLTLHNLPKNLGKIPVVGGVASAAAKAGIDALGIPDIRETIKGGDKGKAIAKAKKEEADAKKALATIKTTIGLSGNTNDLSDPTVKAAIDSKIMALELAEETAKTTYKNTCPAGPTTSVACGGLFTAMKTAQRDLKSFEQEHLKAKDAEKKLKDTG